VPLPLYTEVSDKLFTCRSQFLNLFGANVTTDVFPDNKKRTFLGVTFSVANPAQGEHYRVMLGDVSPMVTSFATRYPPGPLGGQILYKWNDWYGGLQGKLSVETIFNSQVLSAAVECECNCGYDPGLECKCDMSYDYKSYTVNIAPNFNNATMLMGANSRRVTLSVSCPNIEAARNLFIQNAGGSSLQGVIVALPIPMQITMSYRDWGPLIRGEIWIIDPNAFLAKTVYGTEVVEVPQG